MPPRKPPMPAPRLPPSPPPAAPAEPPPEVAAAWIRGGAPRAPQTSADAQRRPETPADAPGRLRGAKALVTREGGRQRRRTTVYLSPETAAALERYVSVTGAEASRVIDNALRDWLARQ